MKPNVIVFVETSLYPNETPYYNLKNYNSFHGCRAGKKRGGVAVYVHCDLSANVISTEQIDNSNFIVVDLMDLGCKVAAITTRQTIMVRIS
jgi:hypothetical protein